VGRPLVYWLFGVGRVPPVVRETLQAEGTTFMEEGIRITVHYRDYRAPGKRFVRKVRSARGAIVLTGRRVIAYARSRRILNVRLDDPRLASLALRLEGPSVLEITVDASVFHEDRSGEITYRFATPHAADILRILEGYRAAMASLRS